MNNDYSFSRLFPGMNRRMHQDNQFLLEEEIFRIHRKSIQLDSQAVKAAWTKASRRHGHKPAA